VEDYALTGDNHDTRVWISDGSGMPFVDVAQLPVSHPGLTGRPAPYKGAVDLSVPIGTARPLASRADDTFVPEAEWCLTFPDGMQPYLAHPERVVDRVVRDILDAGLAVPVGTPVSLVVHDQRANVAGQAELTWHRASGEEPWT